MASGLKPASGTKVYFTRQITVKHEIPEKSALDRLAAESGLAIAIINETSCEISVSNNNSICQNLNPDGEFIGQCSAFCGTAFARAMDAGAAVAFTCHAGLECRAVPIRKDNQPLAAIVGRTFVKAENYRNATLRAISGDWSEHSPTEFFENILLTGSSDAVDKTAERVAILMTAASKEHEIETRAEHVPHSKKSPEAISAVVERFNREIGLTPKVAQPEPKPARQITSTPKPVAQPKSESRTISKPRGKLTAEARAWRSFFGSLLKTDYAGAANSLLEFLAHQYNLSALIWLEKKENRLENTDAFGEMKNRKLRLGVAADDPRLLEAWRNEMPLELGERAKKPSASKSRTMSLFPIAIGDEVSAAIAILDRIEDDAVKKQIARICRSISPQIEILRLRNEVALGSSLSIAVQRFSESLKRIDADDLWLNLTQNAAEMLRAERASLLIYDEKTNALKIKAIIGAKSEPAEGERVGGRVAARVFAKNKAVAVYDVSKTGLPPAPADRAYKTPSFLSCPIAIGDRTMGVMSFTDKASGLAFDENSMKLFQAIVPQLAVAVDRASLKEKAGEFEQLSVTDALTGLLNRRYMETRLMEEIKRSNRHGFSMSFMMLDVDSFKSYNDQFGHPAGDEALKLVAHVIRETLRGADVAARFGGEEFSILLPQTTGEEAAAIAERIRGNVAETKFPHRSVTTSIGVASCSAELCLSADLVSAADKALYAAKRQGRNRVLSFEELEIEVA